MTDIWISYQKYSPLTQMQTKDPTGFSGWYRGLRHDIVEWGKEHPFTYHLHKTEDGSDPNGVQFSFHNPADAMLFKLTWL